MTSKCRRVGFTKGVAIGLFNIRIVAGVVESTLAILGRPLLLLLLLLLHNRSRLVDGGGEELRSLSCRLSELIGTTGAVAVIIVVEVLTRGCFSNPTTTVVGVQVKGYSKPPTPRSSKL